MIIQSTDWVKAFKFIESDTKNQGMGEKETRVYELLQEQMSQILEKWLIPFTVSENISFQDHPKSYYWLVNFSSVWFKEIACHPYKSAIVGLEANTHTQKIHVDRRPIHIQWSISRLALRLFAWAEYSSGNSIFHPFSQ